ncbi:hypothetical protein BGZ63DRAFT_259898 [Mariannaea sp. PMI_226]|nr:hypothetical protein BGZ63DRAFT_259898 [Mariannaea sp. PMI_226]
MPAENETPARDPPAIRGRGRGGRGRGGRGRGGGRGGSNAAVSKTATAAKTGRGGSRRGRAKNFADPHVQASYERQRQLKATYQAVAHAIKPALQELAERSIDEVIRDPESYKLMTNYKIVLDHLEQNFARKMAQLEAHYEQQQTLSEDIHRADVYVAEQTFANGFKDMEEQFFQSQENRLRILAALHAKGLPVDVRDDQYEYKVITDEHYDKDFRIYEAYKDGHIVPYPSRVEGTEMWQKARNAEAAVAAPSVPTTANVSSANTPSTSAPTSTRGGRGRGRGGIKRRAADQPEGQPTPKKSTRSTEDLSVGAGTRGPAPAKGLLASAAEVEETPEGTPGDEESVPASPEPPIFTNGYVSAALIKAPRLPAREKSPPLPKNITEPDEFGFRIYNQGRSFRDRAGNSRLLTPHLYFYEDWEIGFRDTTNDSSKNHTRAKRGKYLDTPNSNGMHFDHWCNGYDFSSTTPEDFDQDLVKRHGVHPKYGIPLPHRIHQHEEPSTYVMPGKPVVYIANPSGRIHHASRSFLKVTNNRRSDENPLRMKMKASMRRFCKLDDVNPDEISIAEYVPTDEELKERSLGTAVKELESRPVIKEEEPEPVEPTPEPEPTPQPETGFTSLSILNYAGAFIEANAASEQTAKAARPAPKPARYDAIRDVFTDSKPTAPPTPEADSEERLKMLAMVSNVVSTSDDPNAVTSTASEATANDGIPIGGIPESDLRSTIPPANEPPPPVILNPAPVDPRYNAPEPHGYMQAQPPVQPPMQPVGPVHTHPAEVMPYPPVHEHAVPPHQPVRPTEYASHPPPPPPPPGPPIQERGAYMSHGGYSSQDPRDLHMAAGRPVDPGFHPRRMSGYAEDSAYSRPYWPQGPPPGPPPPPASASGPSPHFQPARIPFSVNASAEPLPPLRPPRGRNQSVEEGLMDSNMRPGLTRGLSASYYPPGPSMSYRGYPGPEPPHAPPSHAPPPPQLQPIATDRILPNPQQSSQGYMTSPNLGYAHQVLSPTYANPPMAPMAQSPQEPPAGLANSAHRHRSTPSGDAGNKYRKLQPAPVPAHRAWPQKPELKTIPYDHKETGSAAALPSSGPTQIRGWNVNQPRKRGKTDRQGGGEPGQDREDSR